MHYIMHELDYYLLCFDHCIKRYSVLNKFVQFTFEDVLKNPNGMSYSCLREKVIHALYIYIYREKCTRAMQRRVPGDYICRCGCGGSG